MHSAQIDAQIFHGMRCIFEEILAYFKKIQRKARQNMRWWIQAEFLAHSHAQGAVNFTNRYQ